MKNIVVYFTNGKFQNVEVDSMQAFERWLNGSGGNSWKHTHGFLMRGAISSVRTDV